MPAGCRLGAEVGGAAGRPSDRGPGGAGLWLEQLVEGLLRTDSDLGVEAGEGT